MIVVFFPNDHARSRFTVPAPEELDLGYLWICIYPLSATPTAAVSMTILTLFHSGEITSAGMIFPPHVNDFISSRCSVFTCSVYKLCY